MHQEVPGQAECAYVFRSSVPGAVITRCAGTFDGIHAYGATFGTPPPVPYWLRQTYSVSTLGHWTYVSFALNSLEVPIQANHAYIVGFNTLALQSTISTGEVS